MNKEKSDGILLVIDGASGDADLEQTVAEVMGEYLSLWKKKQRSYGPHNIGAFGVQGCLIRANDKIQRLRRNYFLNANVSLSDETIEDTWLDLLGYAIMGLICARGQWPGLEK